MERLAQSHGCITSHSQHDSTDDAALQLSSNANNGRGTLAMILDCSGTPCPAGHSPGSNWKKFRGQTGHWDTIQNNNIIGCASTNAGSGQYCNFCYLYNTK